MNTNYLKCKVKINFINGSYFQCFFFGFEYRITKGSTAIVCIFRFLTGTISGRSRVMLKCNSFNLFFFFGREFTAFESNIVAITIDYFSVMTVEYVLIPME